MSWQSYVDEMIIKEIDCKYAIIAGLTDGQVWASYTKAELAQVSQTELKVIADALKTNPNSFLEKGIHFGSDKYVCLSVEDSVLLGRKGSSPMCIISTNMCLVCAVGDDKCAPGKLNTVVGKVADYLKSSNY